MRRIALNAPAVNSGALASSLEGGAVRVVTPEAPWHNAVAFKLDDDGNDGVVAVVEGRRGQVDIGLLGDGGSTPVSTGTTIAAGQTRLINLIREPGSAPARWLMIRNGPDAGASECDVLAVLAGTIPTVRLTEDDATRALRNPALARQECVKRAWPPETIALVGVDDLPLRVERFDAPFRMPVPSTLWDGAMERVVSDTATDLIKLLDAFRPEGLSSHVALLPREAMRSYLRMNIVRVVRLVELLRRRGIEHGKVLEVGAWFGSFALALRRLGYEVVACDRYSSYGNAFESNVALMRDEGVDIVSTTREDELEQIAALGEVDVVLAAAVIEHVPHTPRKLFETLSRTVRPGGLLALDTPNIARYWNRRALERGETIFQPLHDQYFAEPPWEGHHREFTGAEVKWMLEAVRCVDVEIEYVDYNMLQFEELSTEHAECLAKIIEDPAQSDTVLAAGLRPPTEIGLLPL